MGRLRPQEEPQHGVSTGGAKLPRTPEPRATSGARGTPSQPAGDTPHGSPTGKPVRTKLTASEQARVAVAYAQLPKTKQARSTGLSEIAAEFNVSKVRVARLAIGLTKSKLLPSRAGVGGRPTRMTPQVVTELMATLKEHSSDLSFAELMEITGISASTICRYIKRTKAWRVVSKSTKPHLTEKLVGDLTLTLTLPRTLTLTPAATA